MKRLGPQSDLQVVRLRGHEGTLLALIADSKGQTQPPIIWESFAEVIERTNRTFVKQDFDFAEQDKKKNAI